MAVTLLSLGTVASLVLMSFNLTSGQWSSSLGWGGAGNGKRSNDLKSILGFHGSQVEPKTEGRMSPTDPCLDFQKMEIFGKLAEAVSDLLKLCNGEIVLEK